MSLKDSIEKATIKNHKKIVDDLKGQRDQAYSVMNYISDRDALIKLILDDKFKHSQIEDLIKQAEER